MDNVREQILKTAIRKYGPGTQRDKAIEELSELIRALARADDAENVAEEMADVRIMLDIQKYSGIGMLYRYLCEDS